MAKRKATLNFTVVDLFGNNDEHNRAATDACLQAVARCCPSLKSLKLSAQRLLGCGPPTFTVAGLAPLLQQCTKLHTLSAVDLCGASLAAIASQCSTLRCIRLGQPPTDEQLAAIARSNTALESVRLPSGSSAAGAGGLMVLARSCPRLRSLRLIARTHGRGTSPFSPDIVCVVEQQQRLCSYEGSLHIAIDTILEALAETCSPIRTLQLDGCEHLTDVGVQALARGAASRLQRLRLRFCPRLTCDSIMAIACAATSSLQTLCITDCGSAHEITDHALRAISECRQLKSLELARTVEPYFHEAVTDGGFHSLAKLSRLLNLGVSGCRFVTATALCHVVGNCPALRKLDLTACERAVTLQAVCQVASACPNISDMLIAYCPEADPRMMRALGEQGCPALVNLDIKGCSSLLEEQHELIEAQNEGEDNTWKVQARFVQQDEWLHELRKGCPLLKDINPIGPMCLKQTRLSYKADLSGSWLTGHGYQSDFSDDCD
eukprot:CAMPEP_0119319770 /NCGR_PEP_ID=MMETSP1333-20130426/50334_1 /TAXON_ID=418940 /ORGANISM="Scyphosphaera apsteinii, Strain RCC1455" /LENGTH=491 /DNA_ID=CAMNT_0007326265 /DNA_START=296 /DNA_END=1769 /DNA_ORIENTATION=-